jgi:uncharacterized OB-fold protein
MSDARDGAFSAFLDAIEAGEPFYLSCPEGHGAIPPQQLCHECHSRDLSRTPLPEAGNIETYTVVAVPAPRFSDDSPYVTAIADFGPVMLTGQLRAVDPDAVELGQTVQIAVGSADDERFVAFERR